MKSSNARATDPVVAFPARAKAAPRKRDAEFLPAALEIIETPASPLGRATAATIMLFLAIAVAWAMIGQVDIIATAQGRIIPTGRSKLIQPFEIGVVRAIHVRDGQEVKAGDLLIEIDPTTDASDEKRLAYALSQDQFDIARLQGLLAGTTGGLSAPAGADPAMATAAASQMEAQAAEHQARLDAIDRQIAQKEAEARGVNVTIEKIEASLPLLSEQRDIRKSLLQNRFGTRMLYLQIEQQVIESQHELEVQRQRGIETDEALAALGRQKAEIVAQYRKGLYSDLSKSRVQASERVEEIVKSARKRELRNLRAPVDGVVQQIAVHTLGGVVTPAKQLMVIVPKGVGLEIEALLANRDVGFVHAGQEVAVKVETFSFTRYGLLHGVVKGLSQDAVLAQDEQDWFVDQKSGAAPRDEQERQSRQASYVAHIGVQEEGVQTEERFARLEPGMAVTVEIKTGRHSIMSFLLSPLEKLRQESFGER